MTRSSFPEGSASRDAAWAELERALVAVILQETTVPLALDRMTAALGTHLGVAASVLEGHHADEASPGAHVLLGSPVDGTARTLVLGDASAFDDAERARFKRLYEALVQAGDPLSRSASLLHRLRNRLAGLQANVEYAEILVSEASAAGAPASNEDLLVALQHAMTACREISTTLGAIEDKERRT